MKQLNPVTPWRVPLLGLPVVTSLSSDADHLAALVQPFLSVAEIEGRAGDGTFRNTTSGLRVGVLDVLAVRNNALLTRGATTHGVTLVLAIWIVDRSLRSGDGISPLLGVDDMLMRLVLLLICPELDEIPSESAIEPLLAVPPGSSGRGAIHAVNRLLDWVLADLQRPISLTDMESFSGYSRRSLQKAFHQRLQPACQMIDTAEGKLKLGAIAQACGYTNQASFSRDFREVFGVKPSELGRLHHTSV